MVSLGGRVASGAVFNTTATVVRIGSNLLVLPVLARFLEPRDFGVVQMAMPVVLLALSLSDGGLVPILVRGRYPSTLLWSSALFANLAFAAALTLLVAASAPWLGAYYRAPEATAVVAAMAGIILLQAFSSVPHAWLQRELRFETIAACEVAANIAGIIVAIVSALNGAGAFALVGQQITLYAVKAVLHAMVARPPLTLSLSARRLAAIVPISGRLVGAQIAASSGVLIVPVIIGRALDATALGYYALAVRLSDLAGQVFGVGLTSTLLPALTRLDDRERLKAGVLRVFRYLTLMVFPVLAGLTALAVPVVEIVLGDRMGPVVALIAVLAPAAAFTFVSATSGLVFMAMGAADSLLRLSMARTLMVMIALPIGLNFGLVGAAVAELVVAAVVLVPTVVVLMRRLEGSVFEFAAAIGPPALFAITMGVAVAHLARSLQNRGFSSIEVLTVAVALGAVVYAGLVGVFARTTIKEVWALVGETGRG